MSDPTPHPPTAPEPDAPVAPVIPDVLPLLPLRDSVIFPYVVAPVGSGEDRTVRLVDDAMRTNRLVALVASRDREVEAPGPDDVYGVGIAATILQLGRMGDGVRLVVQGVE
ncbi:MAG: LON peptidase substrate-binding domain-containing protein, partial [Candidatus Limnocylindrales bacterium]